MIEYQCTMCLEIQKSAKVPDICNNCGAKYTDFINLTTNKSERVPAPAKKPFDAAPKVSLRKPRPLPKPEPVTPPPVYKPPVYHPPAPPPVVLKRKSGLYLSKTTVNVNVPLGRRCKETVFIRNLDSGKVTGKVTSNFYLVKTKPDILSFDKFLFLDINIDTKSITSPIAKTVTILLESTAGNYSITLNLRVIETKLFEGFKYLFKPWK